MSAALRYSRRHPDGAALALEVAQGAVMRAHLPSPEARSRFVAAVAKARCEEDEELELLGEPVGALDGPRRARLLRRVGVLSPSVTLITSLNAWENISLPADYHGGPPRERVAQIAQDVLAPFVAEPLALLARLPDQLDVLQRKLVAFARLLVVGPDLAVIDCLEEGLSRDECACVARFEEEYRARHPEGTLLFVDTKEAPA
jgi:ABC-type transporter Mla maintaining outer membrane lipid asymmetry ATPase subunit MlaF